MLTLTTDEVAENSLIPANAIPSIQVRLLDLKVPGVCYEGEVGMYG